MLNEICIAHALFCKYLLDVLLLVGVGTVECEMAMKQSISSLEYPFTICSDSAIMSELDSKCSEKDCKS